MQCRGERLGEDIRELIRGRHCEELEVSILNSLMREMLPDVDVLSTLASTDDVVAPFNARRVILEDWGRRRRCEAQFPEEISKIDHLDGCRRCRVVLGFGGGEGDRLLQLGFP